MIHDKETGASARHSFLRALWLVGDSGVAVSRVTRTGNLHLPTDMQSHGLGEGSWMWVISWRLRQSRTVPNEMLSGAGEWDELES